MTLNVDGGDVGTSNNSKIFANIVISFIGAGILGLPFAFREVSSSHFVVSRVLRLIIY